MTATTLHLPDELYQWLRAEAFAQHTSMSRMVAESLRGVRKCQCAGIEKIVKVDTDGEFAGAAVVCQRCGREFDLDDVSEKVPDGSAG